MVGASLHYLGEQSNARQHLERMLGRYADPVRRSHAIRFQYDQKVAAHMILARILWLQGFPDQARRTAEENVEDARVVDHALSLCNALEVPCLIEIWSGDGGAGRSVTALLDHSARHALDVRHRGARCFHGALLIERGEVSGGLEFLRTALDELREMSFVPYYPVTLGALARAWPGSGRSLRPSRRLTRRSPSPSVTTSAGDRGAPAYQGRAGPAAGGPGAARAAEELFRQALEWARGQGALSMELRGAIGLARLWQAQGRSGEAGELLAPIHGRFTEGFDTADLQAAKTLLDRIG